MHFLEIFVYFKIKIFSKVIIMEEVRDLSKENYIQEKQIEYYAELFSQCSENLFFVYYPESDEICLSSKSSALFEIPFKKLSNAKEVLKQLIFKDDWHLFFTELENLENEKNSANFVVQLLNKKNNPVPLKFRAKKSYTSENKKVIFGIFSFNKEQNKSSVDFSTNLPIEAELKKDFTVLWEKSQKLSGFIMKIDVDNMSVINEQFGNSVGDFVLTLISDCIKRSSQGYAKVYKLSSDEFACVNLTGGTAPMAFRLYESIKRKISETEQKIDYEVVFTVSAGAVAFYNDQTYLDELFKKVNFTLNYAKDSGRNNIKLFNAVNYSKHLKELDLQEKFRESVKNGFKGFELFYQPVIDAKNIYIDSGDSVFNVIGAEALLRWKCDEYGFVSPEEFIPILEKTGLIIPVGRWILLTGFTQCKEFNKLQENFHLSLNLSYVQVKKSDILSDVQIALERSGVNPKNITIELTESGYIDNAHELQDLVQNFSKLGVQVDIDDFGTGYSNLRYLQYLKASTLKLDYSFVHKATGGDEGDSKVIKHISQMAHELGMKVCMEGVETESDVQKLKIYEPDKFQGYYFGRPCNFVAFREHHIRLDSITSTYKKEKK